MIKDYLKATTVEDLVASIENAKAKRYLGAELDLNEVTGQPNIDRQTKIAQKIALGSQVALRNHIIAKWDKVNRTWPLGDNDLHICCREGYAKMVSFMFDPKNHIKSDETELEVDRNNRKNRTALHLCFTPPQATFIAKMGGFEQNGELKCSMPEDVNMDVDWVRPGKQKEREQIIQMLLHKKADPNFPDFHDYYPLHYASMYGWISSVQALLKHRANVDAANNAGETPLMLAAFYGREEVVRFLLEEAEPPATANYKDTNSATAIFYAVKAQSVPVVTLLLSLELSWN